MRPCFAPCRLRIGFAKNAEPLGVAFEVKDTFGDELASELSEFRLNEYSRVSDLGFLVSVILPAAFVHVFPGCESDPDISQNVWMFLCQSLCSMVREQVSSMDREQVS